MLDTQLVIYTTKRSINFVKRVLAVAKNVRVLNVFYSPSLRKFRNLNICKIQQPKQSVGNWKNVMPQRIRRYPNKGSDYSILLTITSNWSRRIGTLIAESKSKHYKNNQGILKLHLLKLQLRIIIVCWCVLRVAKETSDYLTLFWHN